MTINNFISAAAEKLQALFPGARVYADCLPQQAAGAYSIRASRIRQDKLLGERLRREYRFEIAHFAPKTGESGFYDWADRMFEAFDSVTADGRFFRLYDLCAQADEKEPLKYIFSFSVTLCARRIPEQAPDMEQLAQQNTAGCQNQPTSDNLRKV